MSDFEKKMKFEIGYLKYALEKSNIMFDNESVSKSCIVGYLQGAIKGIIIELEMEIEAQSKTETQL